jgi:DNA repair exonuclease SbcCD ATPase subunit
MNFRRIFMDEKRLIKEEIEDWLKSYQKRINQIPESFSKKEPLITSRPDITIWCALKAQWHIDHAKNFLKEEEKDLQEFIKNKQELDERFKEIRQTYKEEINKRLYENLEGLIGKYEMYVDWLLECVEKFEYYKEKEDLTPERGFYGTLTIEEYADMLDIRDLAEISLKELEGVMDVSKYKEKLKQVDESFKSHARKIVEKFNPPPYEYYPKQYWWRNLQRLVKEED